MCVHLTIDRDVRTAQHEMQIVKQAVQSRGFTVQEETLDSREAWLSSLPGNVYAISLGVTRPECVQAPALVMRG